MKLFLIFAIVLISCECGFAVQFGRCELAKKLVAQGISRSSLPNWVCLIEAESGRRTNIKGGPNGDSSFDWGLYQINDKYWCGRNGIGGSCKIRCDSLLSDDITIAIRCALLIYRTHGFNAWYGWKSKCFQKPLPNLNSCFP